MSPAEIAERAPGPVIELADEESHWEPTPEARILIDEAVRSVELRGSIDGEEFFGQLFVRNAKVSQAERTIA